jgi:uncharacterized caspase-like protein
MIYYSGRGRLFSNQTTGVDINGDLILFEEEIFKNYDDFKNTTIILILDCDRAKEGK